ncbi:MAG: hypothetical protein K0S33_3831 [Bacteroidetes bacterium]|jgi:hypothetical protein|nr:hypothetical protein [Bacteroidota bacterium]
MMKTFFVKNVVKISRIATLTVFLALIRCIAECFRLQYYTAAVTFGDLKPFLTGALVCAVALLVITLLSFYLKPKPIILLSLLTVFCLLVVKQVLMK